MGCDQTLIPYISIGNCNSELIFGMRASLRILYKNMTSYPIISKKIVFVTSSLRYSIYIQHLMNVLVRSQLSNQAFDRRWSTGIQFKTDQYFLNAKVHLISLKSSSKRAVTLLNSEERPFTPRILENSIVFFRSWLIHFCRSEQPLSIS